MLIAPALRTGDPCVEDALAELGEAPLRQLEEGACGRGDRRAAPRDERERVVERLGERDRAERSEAAAVRERRPRRDRVPETARRQLERGFHVLDLDHRLELDACLLRPLLELAAGRVAPAVVGVVEDQRRLGETLDRDRLAHALRLAADVDDFLAPRRPDLEPLVVDGQDDERRLEATAAHVLGDLRGVLADEPQRDARVSASGSRRRGARAGSRTPCRTSRS